MTDPQKVFTETATEGDDMDAMVARLDNDQWQSAAAGGVLTPYSSQCAWRGRSADLRLTSVCW